MNKNNDTEQCFEELAKSYPELMEKSHFGESLGVGTGWFNIINVLCGEIYSPVQQAKYRLKAAIEYPRDDANAYLNECRETLDIAINDLPTIAQVKEKFGTLRFYCDGGNDNTSALISFAEAMSGCTCEECGAPGTQDDNGWIKTHCDLHRRKTPNEDQMSIEEGAVSAKIVEDTDPAAW